MVEGARGIGVGDVEPETAQSIRITPRGGIGRGKKRIKPQANRSEKPIKALGALLRHEKKLGGDNGNDQ